MTSQVQLLSDPPRLSETLSAEIRRSPEYIAPCALCSHLGVEGFPDLIRSPLLIRGHRADRAGNFWFSLSPCCSVSASCPWLPTRADVASWWRDARQQPLGSIALENRRQSTIGRLAAAGWEAL